MLVEAGEIATISGQSHGPRKLKSQLMEALLKEEARSAKTPVFSESIQRESAAIRL